MKGYLLPLSTAILASLIITSKSQFQDESQTAACSIEQQEETPCRCCKIACWYTIASAATHELGHIPGQAGEEEAMATLRLIRSCMILECADVCPRMLRNRFKTT